MKKLSLLLIAFVCLVGYTKAQWIPVSGMNGGDFRVLAKNTSYIFAGSQFGGVFRSNDNGNNWEVAFLGLPEGVTISRILATDSVVFAGTGYWSNQPTGIYRSFDNGSTWEIINNGISYTTTPYDDLWITGITFCGSSLFVSTKTNGIYRSNNLGDSWTHASPDTLMEINAVNDICAIGNTLFAATQYGNGLYTSTDFGLTWNLGNSGIPLDFYILDFEISGTDLYVKTSHGIFWSPAMGEYWVPKNTGIPDPPDVLNGGFSVSGATLYASTTDYYEGPKSYKSTNGGNSWIEIPSMTSYNVTAFLIDGNNVFAGHIGNTSIAGNGGGIVRSTDAGANWAPAISGLSGIACTSFTSNSTDIFAGSYYYSGIFNSNDGGISWNRTYLPDPASNSQILSMLSNGTTLFAGVNTSTGVYISNDNGVTWAPTPTSVGYPVYALGANSSYVFAGTSNQGMRRTNDNGATWTIINNNLTNVQRKTIRAIAIDGEKIYIGTSQGIYKSTDNGTTWIAANGGIGSPGYGQVKAIAVKGDTLFAGRGSIARSFDNGTTWTNVTLGQNFINVYSLLLIGDTLFAGADPYYYGPTATPLYEGGVFYSTDWGTAWTDMNSTYTMTPEVISLYSYDNKLFAGTKGNGAWYYELPVLPMVTFNVDMSTAEGFNPASDVIYLTGNFPGATWITPGDPGSLQMTQVGATLIYTHSMMLASGSYEYKYFKNAGWNGGEYTGGNNRSITISADTTVNDTWGGSINWANLQYPGTGNISVGGTYDVYAQAFIPNGITAAAGGTYGLQAWIGFSPDNTDPAFWTDWVAAPFSGQSFDNDEFKSDLGAAITTAGTYYYASRFQFGAGAYVYGGFNGGFWNGTTNVSGELTVAAAIPETVSLNNIMVTDGDTNCYNALQTIFVAGNGNTFTVEAGGSATMIAGQNIIYLPGTTVDSGAYMHGYISMEFCTNPSYPVARNTVQTDVEQMPPLMVVNSRVRIYPNPAGNQFTLELQGKETAGLRNLEIFSLAGVKVIEQDYQNSRKQTVSVAGLAPGIYVVKVMTGGESITLKLVKM